MKEISYLSAPIHIWWDITKQCNFRCRHCYSASAQRSPDELNTLEVFKVIDNMREMKVGFVYILGGEPFIRPDFADIMDYLKQSDLPLMINTNGWFIDNVWARRLRESNVVHLRFSLDGGFAKTHDSFRGMNGSFDRVVRGITLARQAGLSKISCSYTMTKENICDIIPAIELLIRLEVDEIQFGPISDTGRATEYPELLLDANDTQEISVLLGKCMKDYGNELKIYSVDGTYDKPCTQCVKKGHVKPMFMGCQAGRTCFCIDAEGMVIPCLLWREKVAGSVREQSLMEIWNESELFRYLRRMRGEDYPECKECAYADVCARECPMSPSQEDYGSQKRIAQLSKLQDTTNITGCAVTVQGCKSSTSELTTIASDT